MPATQSISHPIRFTRQMLNSESKLLEKGYPGRMSSRNFGLTIKMA